MDSSVSIYQSQQYSKFEWSRESVLQFVFAGIDVVVVMIFCLSFDIIYSYLKRFLSGER